MKKLYFVLPSMDKENVEGGLGKGLEAPEEGTVQEVLEEVLEVGPGVVVEAEPAGASV